MDPRTDGRSEQSYADLRALVAQLLGSALLLRLGKTIEQPVGNVGAVHLGTAGTEDETVKPDDQPKKTEDEAKKTGRKKTGKPSV
ncbi:hypothetical protein [Bifidobacterium tissieri]|uniref:hypothetical protein n=1 Tax=Bifidobacterium tissieri TaxID=1630162 RepID=UPI000B9A4E93|nr:hypothetical protein [Bifidobacterium tissieri]